MAKNIVIILLSIIIIGMSSVVYIQYTGYYDFRSLIEGKKELKIDDTSLLVNEVKNIAELTTQVYYDEHVISITNTEENRLMYGLFNWKKSKKIVIIARGTISAGFDLKNIEKDWLKINKQLNSIQIKLPNPIILDTIINPSGFEIFVEKGKFSFEEVKKLKEKAKKQLKAKAIENGLLNKSELFGKKILSNFFKSLGYEKIIFTKLV